MSIWDGHHHFISEEGYADRLLREMDRLGIERTGLMPIDPLSPGMWVMHGKPVMFIGNAELAAIVKQHRDRFWGYGYIRPGHAKPEDVDQLADLGMAGLKFHLPVKPYGDLEYFPIYARADALRMPCLFHTGIFAPPVPMPGQGIRSENCRPIHLEPIAGEFPNLPLIAAHFGVCWTDEAAALCRIIPNIYADISGSLKGWRFNKPMEWFRQMLYWEHAHRKIVFGSDVHADELESTLNDQKRIIQGIGWNGTKSGDFYSGNLKRIFNHTQACVA